MESAEPPGPRSPFPPADGRRRVFARLVDFTLPAAAVLALDPFGNSKAFALAAALVFCGDALFGPGRSPGKRLFSLRVIQVPSGRPITIGRALIRNALFALALVPGIADARLVALAGLGIALAVESAVALRPLQRELGQRRLGDLIAGTQVIDSRIALPLSTPIKLRRAQAPAHPTAVSLAPQGAPFWGACGASITLDTKQKKDAACA